MYYEILPIHGGVLEIHIYIQGDTGEKINSFGGQSIRHYEKNIYMNMGRILNGY